MFDSQILNLIVRWIVVGQKRGANEKEKGFRFLETLAVAGDTDRIGSLEGSPILAQNYLTQRLIAIAELRAPSVLYVSGPPQTVFAAPHTQTKQDVP